MISDNNSEFKIIINTNGNNEINCGLMGCSVKKNESKL